VDDAIEQVTGVSRRALLDRLRPLQPPRAVQAEPSAAHPAVLVMLQPEPAAAPAERPFCPSPEHLFEVLRGEVLANALGPDEVARVLRSEALKGLG
jgi:hypothetical protein